MSAFFVELSFVMLLVFAISLVMSKIKQPLLIGYILTGILAGPIFFDVLSSSEGYETFSHIGIALLLFIVGLHLNLKLIKEVGMISFVTAMGQVFFTSLFGFLIAFTLGFSIISSLVIAIALCFSSTIIIVKLLGDKNDLDKLYGKISMGFLIVQDLIAVLILMLVSSFLNLDPTQNPYIEIAKTIGIGFIAIVITYVLSHYFLHSFLDKIAKSSELFFIFIITWALGISSIFWTLGFSIEIGALLAGIALASSPYQFEISSRVKTLRDFFIIMFFILLGSQMIPVQDGMETMGLGDKLDYVWDNVQPLLFPAILFSVFVLVGNPIIVLVLMSFLGYNVRTGFMAGLTVAQISEFSLILALLAQTAGFLTLSEVSMITFVGIITITFSTYMIMNGDAIYNRFKNVIKKFEVKGFKKKNEKSRLSEIENQILVFGYDKVGFTILESIDKVGKRYTVIDYDPEVIKALEDRKVSCIYGDASDVSLVNEFNLEVIELLISTIPDFETNIIILKEFKKRNSDAVVILTADNPQDALELYKEGADYVIIPHYLGGNYMSTLIESYHGNFASFLDEKIKHMNELKKRTDFEKNLKKAVKKKFKD